MKKAITDPINNAREDRKKITETDDAASMVSKVETSHGNSNATRGKFLLWGKLFRGLNGDY